MYNCLKKYFALLLLITVVGIQSLSAQCPQLYDFFGTPSATPYWYDCTGNNYTLTIQSPDNIGSYTIDWGDGSPITPGGSLIPPASITHNYTATVDTFVVTFTEDTSGCVIQGVMVMEEATSASIQIPIGGLTQACAPAALEFINSSTNSSETTVFTWDFGDGSAPVVMDYTNAGQTVTHNYLQGTVNCVTQVTLTAENYCNTIQGGNSMATFNPIRIWDIDDAAINASATLLCYPDTIVDFTNVTNRNCLGQGNIAQRYEWWNFGDYWGNGYDSIVGWVAWPPANPYTMAYPGIGTYDVMMVDSSFCGLDTAYITVQIVAPPFAALTANKDTICEGESVTFNNLSGGGANGYFWNFGDGTGWNPSAGGSVSHTYNTAGDYTIQVVANITGGTGGCTDTASVDVHVLATPVASLSFDNNNGCDSMYVNFGDLSSVDAISWLWDFDNGQTDNTPAPPIQFYGAPGTYDVQLTVSNANSCSNTTNQPLTVFQSPVPAFTPNSVCVNELASFIDNSTFSVGDSILTWDWDFGDGGTSTDQNPFHMYTAPGFYDMILTVNTAFCQGTDTIQINVENVPTASFVPDTINGCADLLVNFNNTSSINATTFFWDFGDGDTTSTTSPSHLFLNSYGYDTTYIVTMIAQTTFGCSDTVTQGITVYPNPTASFIDDAVLDCAPLIVSYTNTSTGGTSYAWDFGGGSPIDTSTSPVHTYQNLTQFIDNNLLMLTVTSSNGCTDTISKNIVVYPEPQFGFSINPDSGCSPLLVTFPSVIGAVDYQWNFGDGTFGSGPTPNHTYLNTITNNVTYNVVLTATSPFGCVDTTYGDVLVFPNPSAQFTIDSLNGCHPLTVNYTNNSTGGSLYHWNLGDGTILDTLASSFPHTYINTTGSLQQMLVELVAETDKGCKDTLIQNVDVYPDVTAVMQTDTFGCTPFTTIFNNFSIGGVKYFWDFGDGSPIDTTANPTHQFINASAVDVYYTVSLIIESIYGCFDTTYQQILVYPATTAQLTLTDTIGCHPLTIGFTNGSTGGSIYHWDFGDGTSFDTTLLSINHTFLNTSGSLQNFQVSLISETDKGCMDTTYKDVTVYPDVTAVMQVDTFGCSPFTQTFSNFSVGALNYYWDFGDGSAIDTTSNPTHQFVNPGLTDVYYTVTLISESIFGCTDTTYQDILVYPATIAQLAITDTIGCHPLTVGFTNNSIGGTFYHWDFGDGTSFDTTALSFNYTFLNTSGSVQNFQVSLISETDKGCIDTTFRDVTIYPDVTAIMQADTFGCSPFTSSFNNFSIGAVNYYWDFGDGSAIDTTSNPTHQFVNPGLTDVYYTVALISESIYGCTDTIYQDVLVYPATTAQVSTSDIIGCHPLTVGFVNNSIGGTFYHWDFGDGTISDTTALTFDHTFYNTTGVIQNFQVSLISETDKGCLDTTYNSIDVYPDIQAIFIADTSGCSPLNNVFVNNSIGANTYIWDFGDGTITDTLMSPNHQFTNTTTNDITYTVSLFAESIYGCKDTLTQPVTVHTTPVASFTASPSSQTYPSTAIAIANTTSAGTWQYNWNYGDGDTSNLSIPPNHVYSTWGTFTIDVLVEGTYCSDTASRVIEIIPPVPVATFTGAAAGCRPLTVDFTNTSIYGYANAWNFGDGGISTQENPTYTFYNAGVYSVTLTVTGDGGQDVETQTNIIEVYEVPSALFTVSPSVVFIPEEPVLLYNLSNFASSYSWNFGDGGTSTATNPQHYYTEQGFYDITLVASTENNCTDTFRIVSAVEAKAEGGIKIPNAFTPNIGGSNGGAIDPRSLDNDVFHPILTGVEEYELNIFNKWGELLFISTDIEIGWDGYYRGELSQQDVYVYKIKATFIDGRSESYVGDLTLLR